MRCRPYKPLYNLFGTGNMVKARTRRNGTGRRGRSLTSEGAVITRQPTPIFPIRRAVHSGPLGIAVADQGTFFSVGPSNFGSWSELSAIFDLYRIKSVTYTFDVTRCAQPATTGNVFPTLLVTPDLNDSTVPATINDVLDYNTHRKMIFDEAHRSHSITFQPKLQLTSGGGTNTVLASNGAWARTTFSDNWFGLKLWARNYNTTSFNNTVIDVYVTADIEFKVAR